MAAGVTCCLCSSFLGFRAALFCQGASLFSQRVMADFGPARLRRSPAPCCQSSSLVLSACWGQSDSINPTFDSRLGSRAFVGLSQVMNKWASQT